MSSASTSRNSPQHSEQIDDERPSIRRQCCRHIRSFMDRQSHIDGVRGQHRDRSNKKNQKCVGKGFEFHDSHAHECGAIIAEQQSRLLVLSERLSLQRFPSKLRSFKNCSTLLRTKKGGLMNKLIV